MHVFFIFAEVVSTRITKIKPQVHLKDLVLIYLKKRSGEHTGRLLTEFTEEVLVKTSATTKHNL